MRIVVVHRSIKFQKWRIAISTNCAVHVSQRRLHWFVLFLAPRNDRLVMAIVRYFCHRANRNTMKCIQCRCAVVQSIDASRKKNFQSYTRFAATIAPLPGRIHATLSLSLSLTPGYASQQHSASLCSGLNLF